jgi:hypothetical protein
MGWSEAKNRLTAMRAAAAVEVASVACAIVLFIWWLQFTFPDFAWIILGFIILTFFLHGDTWGSLGFGSHGFLPSLKRLALPTAIIGTVLLCIGMAAGTIPGRVAGSYGAAVFSAFGRYFAWSLFQEFGLQSFFTNRLYLAFNGSKRSAWVAGAIFATFHIPNPPLMPLTFVGGVILSKVFIEDRNLIPLALAHAIIGSLASIAIPVAWHHGLRVGPGYFRWVPD